MARHSSLIKVLVWDLSKDFLVDQLMCQYLEVGDMVKELLVLTIPQHSK